MEKTHRFRTIVVSDRTRSLNTKKSIVAKIRKVERSRFESGERCQRVVGIPVQFSVSRDPIGEVRLKINNCEMRGIVGRPVVGSFYICYIRAFDLSGFRTVCVFFFLRKLMAAIRRVGAGELRTVDCDLSF